MPELREALEELAGHAPAPRERFDEELWERVRARERVLRRRWRVATVAAATASIAAVGATGVFALRGSPAGTMVDRTISCRLTTTLSAATFRIGADVKEPPAYAGGARVFQPGEVWVGTDAHTLAGASKQILPATGEKQVKTGYYFDGNDCRSAPKLALSRSGLPSLGSFSRAGNTRISESCSVAPNSAIVVRLRVVLSRAGVPASAQLAIRGGKHPHPLVFVSWTPTRFTAYAAAACVQS